VAQWRQRASAQVAANPDRDEPVGDEGEQKERADGVGDRAWAPDDRCRPQRDESGAGGAQPGDAGVDQDVDDSRNGDGVEEDPATVAGRQLAQ
jgi:hypothetical protein